MKRTLVVLAALLMLASKSHDSKESKTFVLTFDGMTMANGISGTDMNALFKRYGQRFAYFVRDGHRYVILDSETIDRLQALYAPQVQLGQKQAELGTKQSAIGQKQSKIGMEQAQIGMEQSRTDSSSPRYHDLVARQNELARQQNELGEQQNRLGEKQNEMARQQNELARDAEQRAQPIFDQAIRNRVAEEVR